MVWNAGVGLWWAAIDEILQKLCVQLSNYKSAGPFQDMSLSHFKAFVTHCSSQKSALQSMHPAQSLVF